MKIYKNQLIRSKPFIFFLSIVVLLGILSLYQGLKENNLFFITVSLAYILFFLVSFYLSCLSTIIIDSKIYYKSWFSKKEIEFSDIKAFKVDPLLTQIFINLVDNKNKIIIPKVSSYFSNKTEFQEFIREIQKNNSSVEDNINWDNWFVKKMFW